MNYGSNVCPDCRQTTSGDCGRHGYTILRQYIDNISDVPALNAELASLRAALATAEAERDAARQEAAAARANAEHAALRNIERLNAAADEFARLQQEREGLIAAIENIRLSAASALSYGHQATQKDAREMVERKELRLRDILRFCEKAGVAGSPLRAPTRPTETQEPTR